MVAILARPGTFRRSQPVRLVAGVRFVWSQATSTLGRRSLDDRSEPAHPADQPHEPADRDRSHQESPATATGGGRRLSVPDPDLAGPGGAIDRPEPSRPGRRTHRIARTVCRSTVLKTVLLQVASVRERGVSHRGRVLLQHDRGGSPSGPDDFDEWGVRTALNPETPLFREARYLLAGEPACWEQRYCFSRASTPGPGIRARGA